MTFKLRKWELADIDSLIENANNLKIANFMTDAFPHPYTIENANSFIEFSLTNANALIFAIVVNNKAVGGVGVHFQNDIMKMNAEIGYWIGEKYWGKGIMPNAIKEIVNYTFTNYNITRIFARPFETNIASQKVLEKAGFILEAKLEKTIFKNEEYSDELIYSLRKENWV